MIRILSEQLANKIAAGEVITSPVAVVKELMENAIDAGATVITCEIKKGGKELIRVTDNGCGIPAGETEIAFAKHATGKIATEDDLDAIATLGFRGEALGSIATVSDLSLVTKTAEEAMGTHLIMEGGVVKEKKAVGCETGTAMTVNKLFYNTPARLKFMGSDRAEGAKIHDLVSKIAIAYPEIRIKFISNDNVLFTSPGKGDGLATVMTVYGSGLSKSLLPVESESPDGTLHLRAYVSDPMENRPSKRNQIFFVNGRLVKDKVIDSAVQSAYKHRLFAGRYPLVYLFLDVTPDKLDVNIHPSKDEVRFYDPETIENFITEAIGKVLATKDAVPQMSGGKAVYTFPNQQKIGQEKGKTAQLPRENPGQSDQESTPTAAIEKTESARNPKIDNLPIREEVDINTVLSTLRERKNTEAEEQLSIRETWTEKSTEEAFDFSALTPLGIIFSTYILATDDQYLYMIDQHAAHERILFEQIRADFTAKKGVSQTLLAPIMFETSTPMEEWAGPLTEVGFAVDTFGPGIYRIDEIPVAFTEVDVPAFLRDYVDTYEAGDVTGEELYTKMATMACKAAVKGHDVLREAEVNQLLTDLAACDNPFSCPHGRPTFLKMSRSDIERDFKRK